MTIRRCRLLSVAVMAAWLTAACGSAPTRTYTLYATAPVAAIVNYSGPPVRVDVIHLPPALNREEVTRGIGQGEMQLDDLAHWSAPLNQLARQVLSADLQTRLPEGRLIFPHLPKPDGALGLTVEVLWVDLEPAGAHLQASWTVTPGARLPAGTITLQTDQAVGDAAGTARALSTLLALLADRIAASL
jgi:uncharacterized lipoprotein YmbA